MLRLLVLGCLLSVAWGVAAAEPPITPRAFDLIVRWEVGGEATYTRKYQRPIWPGNALSGVTIGIGYDLGHQTEYRIRNDWAQHPYRDHLAAMAGYRGQAAANLVAKRQYIVTPWPLALAVFRDPTLIRYYNLTRRVFPGMEYLHPDTQGSLVDLVYNRGGSMVGEARREMRYIRDVCIPARDDACVAAQLRAMKRVWSTHPLGKGLRARREAEARLVDTRGSR